MSRTSKKKRPSLRAPLGCSLLGHTILIAAVWALAQRGPIAITKWGQSPKIGTVPISGIIPIFAVDAGEEQNADDGASRNGIPKWGQSPKIGTVPISGVAPSAAVGGEDIGDTGGGSRTLAEIRRRVERAKAYPMQARRHGIEGRPEVEFGLTPEGGITFVRLTRPSGEAVLDDAAVATIRRAAPFPYYPGTIRLAIRFDLE